MLGGLTKGKDFRGLISYLCDGRGGGSQGRGEILGGTIGGQDPVALAEAFASIRALRLDVSRPVLHVWASCRGDGKCPDAAQWMWVCATLAERFGDLDSWVCIRHRDKPRHPHAHLVLSRIRSDGTVAREILRDFRIIEEVMAEAEIRFGLSRDPRPERPRNPHGRAPKRERFPGREKQATRNGRMNMKASLRQAIQECEAEGLRGYRLLLAMRERHSWTPEIRWRSGKPTGIMWQHESGFFIQGRRLGDGYAAGPFLERIGGLPGMSHARPLPRNWNPPPYRARGFRHCPSIWSIGPALGRPWWTRAAAWLWRTAWAVVAGPQAAAIPAVPQGQQPTHPLTATVPSPPISAPRRR